MNDLRQVMIGYTQYYGANGGRLMLGYPPVALAGGPGVYDPRMNRTYMGGTAGLVLQRYPWRMLPYVGNLWEILHGHEEMPPLPDAATSDADALTKAYDLSLYPTIGMNSVFVGGDTTFDGFVGGQPNYRKHVVFRASEVRRPTELIVFADCREFNDTLLEHGWFRLTPPRRRRRCGTSRTSNSSAIFRAS